MSIGTATTLGLLFTLSPHVNAETNSLATCVRDIYENPPPSTMPVVLEGMVYSASTYGFMFRDETGAIHVKNPQRIRCDQGDIIRMTGFADHMRQSLPWFNINRLEIIGHDVPPKTIVTEPAAIIRGDHDFKEVTFEGVVSDTFPDELGPGYSWILVEARGSRVAVAVKDSDRTMEKLRKLVDARVSITGVASPDIVFRRFLRPFICLSSPEAITVITPPPADPFSGEPFFNTAQDQIRPLPHFAHRRCVTGEVLATWHGKYAFLRTAPKRRIRIRLASGSTPPAVGARITAAGFVRSNTFFAWLDNAIFRYETDPGELEPDEAPWDITPPRLLVNETGNLWINPTLNGRIVRIRGKVRNVSSVGTDAERFDIECGEEIVPIEIGSSGSPAIGSTVEITGVCAMETEIEDAQASFCRIRGFSVIPRSHDDIRVLAAPPWWTPAKLSALVGALLIILVGLVWRNRQKERQTQRESQLRIDERTKLAVELHDSLAQNLTGISLQLDAAEMAEKEDRRAALTYLSNAREALRSCREGLRYCLSDLRSRSFEDTDMTEAVTETVRPHIGKTRLFVRFNVPRSRLSDSSAHAVLCIVRELAVNAVRHGHATEIHVAGEFRDGQIRFSVRDNGCGFDPDSRPGSAQGHFGLLGINERIGAFKGTLKIDSAIGKGTKATVILNIT